MTPNVFESPLLSGLFGDTDIAAAFDPQKTLECYRAFEVELTRALAAEDLIDKSAAGQIIEHASGFKPDLAAISSASAREQGDARRCSLKARI